MPVLRLKQMEMVITMPLGTYIAIRSGKHSSSTAYSHAVDFKRLIIGDYWFATQLYLHIKLDC